MLCVHKETLHTASTAWPWRPDKGGCSCPRLGVPASALGQRQVLDASPVNPAQRGLSEPLAAGEVCFLLFCRIF